MNTIDKLDPFYKILLATQSINFLAALINDGVTITEFASSEMAIDLAANHNQFLKDMVEKLKPIMEEMGEYVNGKDMVLPIDVRATKAAFDIVVSGKDNVNK